MDKPDVAAGVLSMAVDVNAAGGMQDEVQSAVPGPANAPTSSFEQSAKDYRRDADSPESQQVGAEHHTVIVVLKPMPNTS